ncbi:MAG: hypothetical protein RLZZ08_2069 [Pseudomonadota bacterium]|jgi:hypothetical protein
MPEQTIALEPSEKYVFQPQDRKIRLGLGSFLSTLLSVIVVGAAIYHARDLDFTMILRMVPASPLFWVLFAINYLIVPISDWFIFRRVWGVGANAFAALVRKLICNELLVGYLGEVYFYSWARQNLKFVNAPFGAVKDVAVLSAIAGNLSTLVFLAIAFPFARLLPLDGHANAIGWSLAFVMGTSLAVMFMRRSIFSLERHELKMVFAVHVVRILALTVTSAALWHVVMPDVELGWWLLLVTIRLLISRLPFVPNKDVVFAGIAVVMLGSEVKLAALMAMMAGLMLATHVLVGISFAGADLLSKGRLNDSPAL